jgi:hypothetical protein
MLIATLDCPDGRAEFYDGSDEPQTVKTFGGRAMHYATSINDPDPSDQRAYFPRPSFEQRVRMVHEVLGGKLWIHEDWLDKPEDDERQVIY